MANFIVFSGTDCTAVLLNLIKNSKVLSNSHIFKRFGLSVVIVSKKLNKIFAFSIKIFTDDGRS